MDNNIAQQKQLNMKLSNHHVETSKPSKSHEISHNNSNNNKASQIDKASKQSNFQKREKKAKKREVQEIVVTLDYGDEVPAYCKYFAKRKSQYISLKQRKFSYSNMDICEQSRFKFIFDDTVDITNYSTGKQTKIEWDDIFEVIYSPVETQVCPICIEKSMLVSVITRCGHVFCWPCLKSFQNYVESNKLAPICPYCKEMIDFNLIKFCSLSSSSYYQEGESISFNLIMKDRRSPTLYNTNLDPTLENYKKESKNVKILPNEHSKEFGFSKFFSSDGIDTKYVGYRSSLETALSEELKLEQCELLFDKGKIDSISLCLEELRYLMEERDAFKQQVKVVEEKKEEKKDVQMKVPANQLSTKSDEKNYSYFFQEKNGDIYFLHPIDYNILLTEYGDEESIPTEITGKILEIQAFQMSPTFRNQYNNLNHLREGNLFYLVEIDLKPLVSNITLKQFYNVLKERSKARSHIKDEEDHYDAFVQKLKDKEKEKEKERAKRKFSLNEHPGFDKEISNQNDKNEIQETIIKEDTIIKEENKLKMLLSFNKSAVREKEIQSKPKFKITQEVMKDSVRKLPFESFDSEDFDNEDTNEGGFKKFSKGKIKKK